MKLYLMRHADAGPVIDEVDYDTRGLTAKGRQQTQDAAKKLIGKVDLILTSPLLRAVETAKIVADIINYHDTPIISSVLKPGCEFNDFMCLIDQYPDFNNILCVGHEPDFGILAGQLLNLEEDRPLAKAEVVEIDVE